MIRMASEDKFGREEYENTLMTETPLPGNTSGPDGPSIRPSESTQESRPKPLVVYSAALMGLFILASFYTLYFAREVFIPIVVALLLNFLLRPLLRVLKVLHIPPAIGSALIVLGFLGILAAAASQLAQPASIWLSSMRSNLPIVELKVRQLLEPMREIRETAEHVETLTDQDTAKDEVEVQIKGASLTEILLEKTWSFIMLVVLMFLLLYFILAFEDLFIRKLVRMFPRFKDKRRVVEIANDIENRISTYLVTTTLVNAAFGTVLGTILYALGFPNPVLWAVMIALLEFIPYFGPLVGILVVAAVGVLSFESTWYGLVGPLIYVALDTIEGHVVAPFIFSRRFSLNPVAVLVWLIFWSWLWGFAGALLAVPMLATFKIFCDRIEPLQTIGELIGS